MKRLSIYLQSFFYVFAGLNHFINPDFYYPLIPDYLQAVAMPINVMAGVVEMAFGVMILFPSLRRWGALGIILMLFAFIPSHIYFIEIGSCIDDGLCVPRWLGWIRLVVIHPALILWAWSVRKY